MASPVADSGGLADGRFLSLFQKAAELSFVSLQEMLFRDSAGLCS